MKNSIHIFTVLAALFLAGTSCNRVDESGALRFGLDLQEDNILKSLPEGTRITAALVTITDASGQVIYDKESVALYRFGDSYTTSSMKLPVGQFQLKEFMLIDSIGTVLWATPMAGSELAHLVRQPLPIPFGIGPEETTNLDIQVIRTWDHLPSDFGYVNFDIGFVERFCLSVFYSTRCLEDWPEGMMAPVHQPMLTIRANERMLLQEPLMAGLNRFRVPMGPVWFLISATDCHGQVIFEEKYSLDELLTHGCKDNSEPLQIYRDPIPGLIITPEGLREPTIRQGVFGSVSIPVYDSLNTGNSDFHPVVRDIYFYPYAVMDSIQTFAPMDCYFPADALGMGPLAVVRSNSEGFFQVPLEAGDYLCLVRVGDRYYMDSFVSSHPPGFVTVLPGQVTYRVIHVVDCSMWM